jgi:hypothetical protein
MEHAIAVTCESLVYNPGPVSGEGGEDGTAPRFTCDRGGGHPREGRQPAQARPALCRGGTRSHGAPRSATTAGARRLRGQGLAANTITVGVESSRIWGQDSEVALIGDGAGLIERGPGWDARALIGVRRIAADPHGLGFQPRRDRGQRRNALLRIEGGTRSCRIASPRRGFAGSCCLWWGCHRGECRDRSFRWYCGCRV